jgi:formate dehydrogenase major subunit
MGKNVTLKINGKEIVADSDKTILNVARENGINIPAMCYDPRLEPYRSCLVCVVEDKKTSKLLMSCAMPVQDGMEVETDSPPALQARKAALEFILSTHYADCRGPCHTNCPANIDIQGYLSLANAGKYKEALQLIRETNPMPMVCGRVCVKYCEANCRRNYVDTPAAINFVKRYLTDLVYDKLEKPAVTPKNGKKVAVVGGGPSGLTCAYFLVVKGYEVTIFEAHPKLGGMLRYGIPEYRLAEKVLDKEIDYIISHGINVETGVKIGKDISLDTIKEKGYDAIYLAVGAQVGKPMGIEHEDCPHVLSGVRFLEGVKKNGAPQFKGIVAVVGGGNTAIDVSRTAIRCGAEKVAILYRRTLDEMPADKEEIEDAMEEGVEIKLLTAPKAVKTDNGRLIGLECYEMYLGEPDSSGRRKPLQKKDSEFLFACDHIISAIGQDCDLSLLENKGIGEIKTRSGKTIIADPETTETNVPGVFAGGDVVTGPKAAIDAIGTGRKAAQVIDKYLTTGRIVRIHDEFLSSKTALSELDTSFFDQIAKTTRTRMHKHDPHERTKTFEEVDIGITSEEVSHESSRCLTCGCKTLYDCDLKDFSTEVGAAQRAYRGRFKKQNVDARHPYIVLDPNKCILCGRCIRYCGDLIGIFALGFVNRGFETVMKPAMEKPLAETTCIACGNCIEVCPTGAIEFNSEYKNPGAFRTFPHRSVCSDCGVGCEIDINAFDRDVFYITAKPYDTYTEGELCKKGRFESTYLMRKDRITSSIEDGKGPVTLDDACQSIVKNLNEVKKTYGKDSILFLISPKATNEEIFMFSSLAEIFESSLITSAGDLVNEGFPDVSGMIGANLSTLKQEDISLADLIINIGPGLTTDSPVFGFKVKRAVRNGARFIQIGTLDRELKRYASAVIDCASGKEREILDAIAGSISRDKRFDNQSAEKIQGFHDFLGKIKNTNLPEFKSQISEIVGLLLDSEKKVAIIYNTYEMKNGSSDALKSAANLLLLTGRINSPSQGIIVNQDSCNTQGYRDIVFNGFTARENLKKAKEALDQGKVKAIVSLNEDMDIPALFSEEVLEEIEFVAALSSAENHVSRIAKVLIPYQPLMESEGSLTSSDGRVVKFTRVFEPITGHTNFDNLNRIFHAACGKSYTLDYVREMIAGRLPHYAGLAERDKDSFYLCDEARKKGLLGKKLRFHS